MDNKKLYPPYIESKLPAFTRTTLRVPFRLNRAVGANEVKYIAYQIKTVSTSTAKWSGSDVKMHYSPANKNYEVVINLPADNPPSIGQYYKVQIACVNQSGQIGYYSDVGITKCTAEPEIYIEGLEDSNTNFNQYEYVGVYSQEGKDVTEKVYSYCFDLRDSFNQIVATSGTQIHNSSLDEESFKSSDRWVLQKALEPDNLYTLTYTVNTLNNLSVTSKPYTIVDMDTVDPNIKAQLHAEMNNDDGCVIVSLKPLAGSERTVSGSFVIVRASSENNYDSWHEICRFNLVQEYPDLLIWEDFTVQHGMSYRYALQAYNTKGLYTNRMENVEGPVLADFEDAFLFDGERQLKIQFNPKVSSFKSTILESKMDTLGGKYPFIFRNGNVEYKEFPISGLISMRSDPNGRFMSGINRPSTDTRRNPGPPSAQYDMPHWLTTDNIRKEREFKLAVLDWLNNGKPKLFRSPGEGNYIVRVMNVSLTPNDTLGRMLHTFNSTAYEIAEYTFDNMNSFGFIQVPEIENRNMKYGQIHLAAPPSDFTVVNNTIYLPNAYYISISEAIPYTKFKLIYDNNQGTQSYEVGGTGTFNLGDKVDYAVTAITLTSGRWEDAKLTFGYYDTSVPDNFSYIENITMKEEIAQFIGLNSNIIDEIEDIRRQTGKFYYIKVQKREVMNIYKINGKFYFDESSKDPVRSWNSTVIYYDVTNKVYYNGSQDKVISGTPSYNFQLNNNNIVDFSGRPPQTSGRIEGLDNINKVSLLWVGNGLIVDLVYQLKEILYVAESENSEIKKLKNNWLRAKEEYEKDIANGDETATSKAQMDSTYKRYVTKLEQVVEHEKEAYYNDYAI